MIVDDEPVIRFGLKASVDWKQEGLQLLGDFPNGEKALEAMDEQAVDLLITDIKMPIMDGITLMKETLKRYPNVKVVLVSSYNDFEYVREGLKHGAVDYVLKPTLEPEDFLQIIRKSVSLLKKERVIEEKLHLVNETKALQQRKRVEQQLKRMLLQGEKESIQSIWNSQQAMTVMYIQMIGSEVIVERKGKLYQSYLLDEIQESFYSDYKDGICIQLNNADIVVVVPAFPDAPQRLHRWLLAKTTIRFTIGHEEAPSIHDLQKSFTFCKEASKRRFYQSNEEIFAYTSSNKHVAKRLKGDQLKQFLIPYDKQKVMEFLQVHFVHRKEEMMEPDQLKDEACDILTQLFMGKIEDVALLLDKCSVLKKAETVEDLLEKLKQQIKDCEMVMAKQDEKPFADNELIEKALEYIHQHYTDEVTLQKVAAHIHISRNYFSILFKRYLHQNFIDYVIDLRIKKAKELLKNTSLKVYEVAGESGFGDVKYFSKLFKRTTGNSPGDYRLEHHK